MQTIEQLAKHGKVSENLRKFRREDRKNFISEEQRKILLSALIIYRGFLAQEIRELIEQEAGAPWLNDEVTRYLKVDFLYSKLLRWPTENSKPRKSYFWTLRRELHWLSRIT